MQSFILRSIAEQSAEEKKRSESSKRQRRKEKTVALPACIVFRAPEATSLPRTLTTAQQKKDENNEIKKVIQASCNFIGNEKIRIGLRIK